MLKRGYTVLTFRKVLRRNEKVIVTKVLTYQAVGRFVEHEVNIIIGTVHIVVSCPREGSGEKELLNFGRIFEVVECSGDVRRAAGAHLKGVYYCYSVSIAIVVNRPRDEPAVIVRIHNIDRKIPLVEKGWLGGGNKPFIHSISLLHKQCY